MNLFSTSRTYIKISGLIFLLLSAIFIGLAFFLPRLLDINAYRDDILATLQKSLNRKVSFSRAEFSMQFGPSFVFDTVVVKEPDGGSDFLTAQRITINLALLPLLEKRIAVRELTLEGVDVRITRNSDGKLNIDDLLQPRPETYRVGYKKLQVKKGILHWRDDAPGAGITADITDLNLALDNLSRGHKGSFKVVCTIPATKGPAGSIAFSGTARLPKKDVSLWETEVNATTDIRHADIGRFWPYYGHFIPFGNPGGRLDIATSFKGKPREFSAKGKISVNGAAVTWPTIFHSTVAPRSLQLDYSMKLTTALLDIPALELSTDGFRITGSLQIHDYAGKDPRIVARATTPSTFRYEDVRTYVPYGIIPPTTSDYIEHKIKSGIFKLDAGVLDGRVSQIAHMERGENYNTLLIRGPVEKAVLSYGGKAPIFNDIKGTIELKGKNFNLVGMTGRFGTSPFKLQGSITEYNTDKSSDYPVRMEVTPQPPEIAWLAKIAGADKLNFSGASTLILNGSGHFSAYRLSGDWELRQAAYSFPGAIRKPAGIPNHMAFSTVIKTGETKLTSLTYKLSPLILSATALLKYGDSPHLGFELQTNQFLLNDALPILPQWRQYRPNGRIQAHITGSGSPEDFSAMDYSGAIALNAFSFQPVERRKPINNVNGSVTFKGNSLETSSISVRYGNSPIVAKGKIRNFKNPEAEITLSSPEFFLTDAGLVSPKADASIRNLKASFVLQDSRYTIRYLSGLVNSSHLTASGTYTSGSSPEANLTVTSPKLNLDDVLGLGNLEVPGDAKQNSPKLNLKVKLSADSGSYHKIQFTKLNTTMEREGGTLFVRDLDSALFGGRLSAKGRIVPTNAHGNRYDVLFTLDRVNAEHLFQALDVSREVTGTLHLQGDLTARGASWADIKQTVSGNVQLRLEKGKLRKFSVLSKVFSILNVSQLLKFQLPDMVSGGMPYNEIKGNIAIKDGVASSQDMFIRSDAMNISIIGKTDLVKEEVDLTVGVQPLQTVDKIVNRIPVVGWLLTGKGKAVLTAYFEAKGKWSDPKVTAIPVKSLAKGALNVFRRVFELPVRLFTDTGEVILGN